MGNLLKITALAVIIVGALLIFAQMQERIDDMAAQTAQIRLQIENEHYVRQEIESMAEFATQRREYIEDLARRHLGLVHRDEIIFRMVD
jgi:cell division protein FtsB